MFHLVLSQPRKQLRCVVQIRLKIFVRLRHAGNREDLADGTFDCSAQPGARAGWATLKEKNSPWSEHTR